MSNAPTAFACPSCGASDSIDMTGGARMCLACRFEWKPGELDRDLDEAIASAERRGATDELDATAPIPDNWEGAFVRAHEGGTLLLVLVDNETGELVAQESDGTAWNTHKDSVIYIGDVPAPEPDETELAEGNEAGPLADVILTIAALALTVGAELADSAGDGELGAPPIGWLPPPADEVPEVEQGVAYAVASLVRVFGLDPETVRTMAAGFMPTTEATTSEEMDQ